MVPSGATVPGYALPVPETALTLAISNGDVILIIALLAIPIAAIAFIANAGNAFRSIGKGGLSVEFESDNPRGMTDSGAGENEAAVNEAELRQMLEAKAYRQQARGETPLDVDAELAKALAEQRSPAAPSGGDPQLREEVRQLVVARNERRARQGKEPLDVDAEVERQLQELENLGQ
jgi:hypothetical protein